MNWHARHHSTSFSRNRFQQQGRWSMRSRAASFPSRFALTSLYTWSRFLLANAGRCYDTESMQFFSASSLRAKSAHIRTARPLYKSADTILASESVQFSNSAKYDIFLSHSFLDADIIYGLKTELEGNGFSVYVYWIEDPADRSTVTPETADRLRSRMKCCKALLYATSENADNSKWMPWELGYFDGIRGRVAICPISDGSSYHGREYLGLYPIMERDLWLHKGGALFKKLKPWIEEN
jgi:hypothetical protein